MRITLFQLDAVATILWVIMDTLWLWEQPLISVAISPFIFGNVIYSYKKTKSDNVKQLLIVTILLLMMNVVWISVDMVESPTQALILKTVATCFAVGSIVMSGLLTRK
jgi:hypothetical protein